MKLSEIKNHLQHLDKIGFQLPNGELVAPYFHVTEVGKVMKDFIDCGGKVRSEVVINFQLWEEKDYDHRLHPEKLLNIIKLSEKIFKFDDLEIEVEYQGKETIGKYNLDFDGKNFLLISKLTACLAREACGISEEKPRVRISEKGALTTCEPNTGCC
jgi:superfamily II helicase